jgi:hypothetical protein
MMSLEKNIGYGTIGIFVGFEVLTAVVMKSTIFWNITPCSPLKVNRRALLSTCFYSGLLIGLFFDPENEDNIFLRNLG